MQIVLKKHEIPEHLLRFFKRRPSIPAGSDLLIPHRFAIAMQAAGWLLRSSVLWAKLSPMPESISGWRWERHRIKVKGDSGPNRNGLRGLNTDGGWTSATHPETRRPAEYEPCPGCDRCLPNGGYVLRKGSWRPTRSHEHVFIFAKSDKYWCDGDAVRTPAAATTLNRDRYSRVASQGAKGYIAEDVGGEHRGPQYAIKHDHETPTNPLGANLRDVLTLGPEPCSIALILNPSQDCPVHAGQPGPIYVDRPPPSWKRCKCERTSHFAAFPTTLCRPFLEAFCPARCCAACGTGWVRVVEREAGDCGEASERPKRTGGMEGRASTLSFSGNGSKEWAERGPKTTTLGWRPACNCNSQAEPVAGLCLDPFSGTGTLALTARRMGLRAIGVELSESYCVLSRERLRRDNLLFSEMPPPAPGPQSEPEPEPDLFGSLED